MSDDDDGATSVALIDKNIANERFGRSVEISGWFVEYQYGRASGQRACKT